MDYTANEENTDRGRDTKGFGCERVTLELNRKRPGRIRRCEGLVSGPGRFGLSREKEAAGAAR